MMNKQWYAVDVRMGVLRVRINVRAENILAAAADATEIVRSSVAVQPSIKSISERPERDR